MIYNNFTLQFYNDFPSFIHPSWRTDCGTPPRKLHRDSIEADSHRLSDQVGQLYWQSKLDRTAFNREVNVGMELQKRSLEARVTSRVSGYPGQNGHAVYK
jgi:hypothetical protein